MGNLDYQRDGHHVHMIVYHHVGAPNAREKCW